MRLVDAARRIVHRESLSGKKDAPSARKSRMARYRVACHGVKPRLAGT